MLKHTVGVVFLSLFMVLVLLSGTTRVHAENPAGKDWTLNLKDVSLEVFLEQVSAITGENFVVDPQVKGKVTVIATTPMNRETVNEVMLSVLRVNLLTALPSGPVTRIIPQGTTRFSGSESNGNASSQRIITRVLPVRNANVSEVARLLKPLVSPNGYLDSSEFSSSVIVSDYADNIASIVKTLASLDKETATDVEVIPLRESSVGNIVPLIEAIAPLQLSGTAKDYARLRVIADEHGNSIIVRGDARDRDQIRKLVEMFDRKTANASNIQMIHLQYADAKEVAAILRGSVSTPDKSKSPSSSGTTGDNNPPGRGIPPGVSTPPSTTSSSASATDITGKGSFIQADTTHNTLIIKAEPAVMSEIKALVLQLDTRRPQVLIEAAIVEISATKTEQLGIQLAGGDTAQGINAGSTQFTPSGIALGTLLTQLGNTKAAAVTGEGLSVALGTTARFDVLIQALAGTSGVNLLSTPSIITLDNEEAKIVVGQNVPFRTGDFSTQSSGVTNPFTTIERQDIGVTLKVIPQIHEGNLVSLAIEQEVSSIAPANTQPTGVADIVTNKRTITTKVLAEDKETIVLGGLMEDNVTQSESKIPLLGDLPFIGALFRYKSQEIDKTNLVVFLRPTVVRGRSDMAGITQERYGRIYDLEIGKKDLMDVDKPGTTTPTPTSIVPPAGDIFNVPSKRLTSLLSTGSTIAAPAEPVPAVSVEPSTLPWLVKKKPAEKLPDNNVESTTGSFP